MRESTINSTSKYACKMCICGQQMHQFVNCLSCAAVILQDSEKVP